MKLVHLATLSSLFVLAACASETAKPEQDTGLVGGDGTAIEAPDTNPAGEPYPTESIGTSARAGSKPGNKISNYKFLGYPDGDTSRGLQPISLASFYDPTGRTYKLIHIAASGVWCVYCQKEAEALAPIMDKVKAKKVVWLMSLAEGPTPGSRSTQKDLDGWMAQYPNKHTYVLDPGNANLGVFYDAAALPWNGNINARTMEILSSGVGAKTTAKEIEEELDEWLAKVDSDTN